MRQDQANDIAKALIAVSSRDAFDVFSFYGCERLITDAEVAKIIAEINSICDKAIGKIEAKHGVVLRSETKKIIDAILYEQ